MLQARVFSLLARSSRSGEENKRRLLNIATILIGSMQERKKRSSLKTDLMDNIT